MSFTYDLNTEVGKVRLEIGDVTTGRGILPDGSNISDEEVQVYLEREGSVMRAVAGACEMLATRYAALADVDVGPRSESLSQISKAYRERAKELRQHYGGGSAAFAASVNRTDGNSENDLTNEYAR